MSDKPFAKTTRIRIEATGNNDDAVRDALSGAMSVSRDWAGGEWEVEPDSLEVQTTKDGYWGRLTIRRKDAQGDPISRR